MTAIKPILKYPGAKWNLAEWGVSHMPQTTHYLEPYFGSGALFFNKSASPHEVINDLDGRLVNLFRVARTRGAELAALVDATPYARSEYHLSYEIADDPLEDARRFLVRCWMAHGFKPYCRTGWRHNGSKSLQPITNLWNDLPARIHAILHRLKDAEIESLPALVLIERYKTADTLIYADPPYVLSTRSHRKIYGYEMTDVDHLNLLDALDAHPGPVILSGYHSALYTERLTRWHVRERQTSGEKGTTRTEVLWLNQVCVDRLGYGPMFDL